MKTSTKVSPFSILKGFYSLFFHVTINRPSVGYLGLPAELYFFLLFPAIVVKHSRSSADRGLKIAEISKHFVFHVRAHCLPTSMTELMIQVTGRHDLQLCFAHRFVWLPFVSVSQHVTELIACVRLRVGVVHYYYNHKSCNNSHTQKTNFILHSLS